MTKYRVDAECAVCWTTLGSSVSFGKPFSKSDVDGRFLLTVCDDCLNLVKLGEAEVERRETTRAITKKPQCNCNCNCCDKEGETK